MSKSGEFVSRNAKAVVSGIGGILSVGTEAAGLIVMVPDPLKPAAGAVAGFLAFLEVLRTINVWIVRNEPKIVEVVEQVEDLYEDVAEAFEGFRDGGGKHRADDVLTEQ